MSRSAGEFITTRRWAIIPSYLSTMLAVAERQSDFGAFLDQRQALQAKDAAPLPTTRRGSVRDGVAILDVVGPIFPRANIFTQISGGVSCQALAKDFRAALDDPKVKAILLNVDSPGGEITLVDELSSTIYGARGVKPIAAYVFGLGASAGYWLASACDQVYAGSTAEIGSIGVVATITKDKSPDGAECYTVVSSKSPKKRIDIATEEGKAQAQTVIDDLADIFIQAVARNRRVSVDKVESDFGKGDVMIASKATGAGMIDGVSSFEEVLSRLAGTQTPSPRSSTSTPRAVAAPTSARPAAAIPGPTQEVWKYPPRTQERCYEVIARAEGVSYETIKARYSPPCPPPPPVKSAAQIEAERQAASDREARDAVGRILALRKERRGL